MLDWSIDDESESPLLIQTSRYTLEKLVPQLFFQRKVAIPNLRKLALYSILRCWNILEILTHASIFIKKFLEYTKRPRNVVFYSYVG